jgi:16S rRNA (guanine1207-N2)-methyltransferase
MIWQAKLTAEADVLAGCTKAGVPPADVAAVRAAAAAATLRPPSAPPTPAKVRDGVDVELGSAKRSATDDEDDRSGKRRREDRPRDPHNFFTTISEAGTADGVLEVLGTMPGGIANCSAASLAHALHVLARKSPPRKTDRLLEALRACSIHAGGLALRGLSKLYWAVVKINQAASEHGSIRPATLDVLRAAGEAAVVAMPTFDARGVVTVLHAHATVDLRLTGGLGVAALDRLEVVAPELSGQDVANCWWALAKLKLGRDGGYVTPLRIQTAAQATKLKPQELSMTLWALATLGTPTEPALLEVLAEATAVALPRCAPQGVANTVWAWAKIGGAPADLVDAMGAAVRNTVPDFTEQGLSASLWSCAKLGCPKKLVLDVLEARGVGVVATMNPLELTNLVWALAAVGVTRKEVLRAVGERAAALGDTTDWQLIGHLQHLDRATAGKLAKVGPDAAARPGGSEVSFRKFLRKRGRATVSAASAECAATRATALDSALSTVQPWATPDFCSSHGNNHVLLANIDSAMVEAALTAKSLEWTMWSRTSTRGGDGRDAQLGRPWPTRCPDVGECIARLSHFRAATDMMLGAIAAQLVEGGGLWLVGTAAEGIHAARQPLQRLFAHVATVPDTQDSGLVVLRATGFFPPHKPSTLDAWCTKTTVQLCDESVPWVTYPGLFANGELDVMTSALLSALPLAPAKASVLDVCCGSGTIAAALLLRNPTITVQLLDNDSVACKAAKKNVKGADKVHLASGLTELHSKLSTGESGALFDWIVSNPPVHDGLDSDFAVLDELVRLGPECLAPGGSLFFVTQTYIPVESLSTKHVKLDAVWTDGRFTVWCHVKAK